MRVRIGRATAIIYWTVLGVFSAVAQTKTTETATPSFEVASVRISDEVRRPTGERFWGETTGRVSLEHIPLSYLLMHVYDLRPDQLSGPAWLAVDYVDIHATVPAGAPKEQIPLMFQSVLAERFKLRFHRQPYTARVYDLVLRKGGPKLKAPLPSEPQTETAAKAAGGGDQEIMTKFGISKMTIADGIVHYEYPAMTMSDLAEFLSGGLLRDGPTAMSVLDATGLLGPYDVLMDISASDFPRPSFALPPEGASEPSGASLLDSLHKMGLDLVRRETQSEKFVIDHIDPAPTPN